MSVSKDDSDFMGHLLYQMHLLTQGRGETTQNILSRTNYDIEPLILYAVQTQCVLWDIQ